MHGLSLMQTRSFIDRLGDLDEEITKVCRAADVMAKDAGKDHADGVGRLKEACEALQDKQKYVREAKDCLLGFDGFLHALSGDVRQLMEHPRLGSALGRISDRMAHPLEAHVANIIEETIDGLRRVAAAVKALRESKEDAKRAGSIKESVKALSRVCSAAENAVRKALKHAEEPKEPEQPEKAEVEEEVVVEKAAGVVGFHGYNLTAGLPPEFLENAKKKKEEAEAKKDDKDDKDDEKKSSKKADSRVPGNESKGPKDEGEEDEGWVPGHRTTQEPTDEKEGAKKASDEDEDEDEKEGNLQSTKYKNHPALTPKPRKLRSPSNRPPAPKGRPGGKKANADHGYVLTADSKDPDPSMEEDLPGEDDDGKPVVDKSAYQNIFETPDHGYELFA